MDDGGRVRGDPLRRLFIALVLLAAPCGAQIYDTLLKNGHVIDPKNGRNGRFDIAIIGNKIVRVAQNLPAAHAQGGR